MASCYAALVSLQTTIHSILNHPNPPIALDHHQAEALLHNSASLQNFLEHHSHREDYPTDELKNKIRDAVYAAEDLIEKCTAIGSSVRCILQQGAESVPDDDGSDIDEFWMKKIMEDYNLGISVAIQDMNAIIKEITEDEEKPGDLQIVSSTSSPSLASSPSANRHTATVEFDDVLNTLLDMLTGDPASSRQIIPITGMGGIGKTTLATQAYQRFSKVKYFDVRVWVTISQNFREREFFLDILGQLFAKENKEKFYKMDKEQMLLKTYQHLKGRRYLIIFDDVWSIDEEFSPLITSNSVFPDDANGSRIIVTTRVSSVGVQLSNNSSSGIQMSLLDDDQSWKLFSETVFKGEVCCPSEFEEIGKTIAINCGGLPLSIVVVGGFLAKSDKTKQYWEYVARDLTSIVNSKDYVLSGEYRDNCLNILYLSYKHLPIHLKPCFLYMGILGNGARTTLAILVELLVAEGFLKPMSDKCMEVIAQEYIEELADRNLISINGSGILGRYCGIHDVVRELCKREARREKFLHFVGGKNDKTESVKSKSMSEGDINRERRIVVEDILAPPPLEWKMIFHEIIIDVLQQSGPLVDKESLRAVLQQSGPFNEMLQLFGALNEESLLELLLQLLVAFLDHHLLLQQSALDDDALSRVPYFEELKHRMLQSALDASRQQHFEEVKHRLQSASSADAARSLVSHFEYGSFPLPTKSCLLRVVKLIDESSSKYSSTTTTQGGGGGRYEAVSSSSNTIEEGDFEKDIIQRLFNSRYVAVGIDGDKDYSNNPPPPPFIVPCSLPLLWNLETLILHVTDTVLAPIEIWKMSHLKHLKVSPGVFLPDHDHDDDDLVLGKLQTLCCVINLEGGHSQWIKKIPNIRKLRCLMYREEDVEHYSSCLSNLQRLHKMESLSLCILDPPLVVVKQHNIISITFPHSLRKLTFQTSDYDWQDVTTMIGALPNLENLTLHEIRGTEWILTQGQFLHLKALHLSDCRELKYWKADDDHTFPHLEYLYLGCLRDLEEIPSTIADAPNLREISLEYCSDTSAVSAKQIVEGQEAYGDSELLGRVTPRRMSQELKRLESPNFQVFHGEYTDKLVD